MMAKLKLPKAMGPIVIHVFNSTNLGYVVIKQSPAKYIDGKWFINLYIVHPDDHLKLVNGDDEPNAA